MATSIQIVNTQTPLGRITVSTANFSKGSVVFQEHPLIAIQSVFNKSQALVCCACHRFIGNLGLQADLLTRQTTRLQIVTQPTSAGVGATSVSIGTSVSSSEQSTSFSSTFFNPDVLAECTSYQPCNHVLCPEGCGEVYCSEACVAEHGRRGHAMLCTGPHSADHPIVEFKTHAVITNEIFLFAASVAVDVVERWKKTKNINEAWKPYVNFVQEPWWDAVHAPDDAESPEAFAQTLKTVAGESLQLFHRSLEIQFQLQNIIEGFDELIKFFDLDRWGKIVGMFEQNQLGIRVPSPLGRAVQNMSEKGKNMDRESIECILDLADRIDAAEDIEEEEEEEEEEKEEKEEKEEEGVDEDEERAAVSIVVAKGGEVCMECVMPDENVGSSMEDQESSIFEEENAYARLQLVAGMADEYFPPLDGTALFTVGCSMNHSCTPNVSPVWVPAGDASIQLHFVALKEIKEGDELNFSYIDANIVNVKERRNMLRDYGFICQCVRCQAEAEEEEKKSTRQ
jgi:hypothetical protein